jgi:hypothetical protein
MRFQLTQSVNGTDASGIHRHLAAGTIVVDTVVNMKAATDVVMPSVLKPPLNKKTFVPLDASASAALGVPVGTNSAGAITGGDSIQP